MEIRQQRLIVDNDKVTSMEHTSSMIKVVVPENPSGDFSKKTKPGAERQLN